MSTVNFKFELGQRVRDRITGLQGIVIGNTSWVTGCNTVTVKPEVLENGKPIDSVGFDEPWVELVDEGISFKDEKKETKKKGGPGRNPAAPSR